MIDGTDHNALMARRACAQFGEMMAWLGRGWVPAAGGRRCPECGGAVWVKAERRVERHRCVCCGWGKDYSV